MTKKQAREAVEAYKDMTAYFDGSISHADMFEMFRDRMHFGEAETRVIISALILAGAKFN